MSIYTFLPKFPFRLFCILLSLAFTTGVNAFVEGMFGKLEASATLRGEYDSRVFGISTNSFQGAKSSNSPLIAANELKSEDDFLISLSPALHFTKQTRWFTFSGTGGLQMTQYIKNNDKSYTQPLTTFTIDFDETLTKNKRVSNNAKIRFDATFDLGQSVGGSVLEQDLIAFTYFVAGFNVRYNHSPKFGVGAGTSYNVRYYQSGSTQERVYHDITTIPVSLRAFYIYSEKLDFYSDYTFSRTNDDQIGSNTLSDSISHSITFGAQGNYSSKLSGNANVGYALQDYENAKVSNQDNLITSIGLDWNLNTKTSLGFDVNRAFSPSAQGFSTFSTMGRVSVSHRLNEKITGLAYLSGGNVSYTYPTNAITSRDSSSLNQFGLGASLQRRLTPYITISGGYDFSFTDRSIEEYSRHLFHAQATGRF